MVRPCRAKPSTLATAPKIRIDSGTHGVIMHSESEASTPIRTLHSANAWNDGNECR